MFFTDCIGPPSIYSLQLIGYQNGKSKYKYKYKCKCNFSYIFYIFQTIYANSIDIIYIIYLYPDLNNWQLLQTYSKTFK